ncbi:ABC transporter ATP-binding protein [Mycoplasmopsis caviae]|uniref:ABC transporter ATP-binding protein n=1 Tax=Mycoplasmopsis caviae TaxID=55603 RepID=A0A3P8LIA1_9BACT|nr:ABC transporter ATP-binding protein [Mycoplasmopsis caviae]UUD35031.1 ABC transporter ATP-binding protein [Mycoplasmopsis caviae]VDR42142.1 phosphate ABC transporter ATP-binding protein [Mycoplasmopsis caviae]
MPKYYIEKRKFAKSLAREIKQGTDEMLNAYPDKKPLVEIRHLDVDYGFGTKKFSAIKDLNLNIYDGEVLGLVGESGSGKSTTGRAIIGLTPHTFGYIKILDRVIPKNLDKGFKWTKKYKEIVNFMVNKVQMIFQDPTNSLNPYKNVETVVGEGLTNLKNSKYIYLTRYNELVLRELNQLVVQVEPDKPLVKNWIKTSREIEQSIEKSNEFVYKTIYEEIHRRYSQNAGYKNAVDFLEIKKVERKTLNNLNEKECKKRLIVDILKQVGLDETVLSRFPLEFSGGQQQRLGICRSVVLQPKLLIADEPISALDVSIQAQVINIFNELKEKYNLTILFIAHDLRMVEYISDRIAVINKGVLLEVGPTDEIIHNAHHPYTRSLLDAVPSIESEKGSLLGYIYDPSMHKYDEKNQPVWQNLGNNHFVLATDEELAEYKKDRVKWDKIEEKRERKEKITLDDFVIEEEQDNKSIQIDELISSINESVSKNVENNSNIIYDEQTNRKPTETLIENRKSGSNTINIELENEVHKVEHSTKNAKVRRITNKAKKPVKGKNSRRVAKAPGAKKTKN